MNDMPVAAAAVSLHVRILADIERRILRGDWPPGHRIPFEHELAAQYRCSRMTVNKVLTRLADAGLIERRRKAGSFVLRPRSESAVLDIPDIRAEAAALGLPYRYEITGRRPRRTAPPDLPTFESPVAGPWLALTCRHFAGARPFCLEQRAISLAAVPEAAAEAFATLAPGAWLVSRVPWTAAQHRIHAGGADATAAAALDVPPGAPCLVIERRTWLADQPVTSVRLTYPGDAHALVARFAPQRR